MPPHIFKIAHNAYTNLFESGKDQSVIICGESGSGKTEATKHVLNYLTHVSGKDDSIGRKIVSLQPLIESFGNAKTVRNNNSSRFGKWSELFWNKSSKIVGMNMIKYLLEKSRVVGQARIDGERNYHIFYQIVKCLGKDSGNPYALTGNCKDYEFLIQGNCVDLPLLRNHNEQDPDVIAFEEVCKSMKILEFGADLEDVLFRIVAAILHFGNIKFVANADHDPTSQVPTIIENRQALETGARLLKVDPIALETALMFDIVSFPDEKIIKSPAVPNLAASKRDALCKLLYSRVFDWIFSRANETLGMVSTDHSTIGLLDIFGFEKFTKNYFEQFCINFANEKLQNHFIEFMVKLEIQEYLAEGIEIADFTSVDNSSTLDLIEEKSKGILYITLDLTKQKNAKDETLLSMLHDRFRDHEMYEERISSFIIKHYAEDVEYSHSQWLEKNRDKVSSALNDVVIASEDPFIKTLHGSSRSKAAQECVGMQFRESLGSLMDILNNTEPHFVRCLKPNLEMQSSLFDGQLVMKQLRYLGIEGICRIRQAGFPMRFEYSQFKKHYPFWFVDVKKTDNIRKEVIRVLNDIASTDDVRVGKNKIFMKGHFLDKVDDLYSIQVLKFRITIQARARAFMCRQQMLFLREGKAFLESQEKTLRELLKSSPVTAVDVKKASIIRKSADLYSQENPFLSEFHYNKQAMMNILLLESVIKIEGALQKSNYDSIADAIKMIKIKTDEARKLLGSVQTSQTNMYRKSSTNLAKKVKSLARARSKRVAPLSEIGKKSIRNLKLDDASILTGTVSSTIRKGERRVEEIEQLLKTVKGDGSWKQSLKKSSDLMELADELGVAASKEFTKVHDAFIALGGEQERLEAWKEPKEADTASELGSFKVISPTQNRKFSNPVGEHPGTWLDEKHLDDEYGMHRNDVCSISSLIWGLSVMNPWIVLMNSSKDLRSGKVNV